MMSNKTLPILIFLLILILETHGENKKTQNQPVPEGWDGFGTHLSTICNIHPFIYSLQSGLSDLLINDTNRQKVEDINISGTLSMSVPISWIAADYVIHQILLIGFRQSDQKRFMADLNRIKPVVNRKSAINAWAGLSRISDVLDFRADTSKTDSIKEINTTLSMAIGEIIVMLEPFSRPEIQRDIDQYDHELQDTCYSFEGFAPDNPVIKCSEQLLQIGADSNEIIDKNIRLLKMLVKAAREKQSGCYLQ